MQSEVENNEIVTHYGDLKKSFFFAFCCSLSGKGDCDGATVELALNYVADLTFKKQGGMFSIADVPYNGSSENWVKCNDVTSDKTPVVGIEGWTQLPDNDYKATMNAVAKVCQKIFIHIF